MGVISDQLKVIVRCALRREMQAPLSCKSVLQVSPASHCCNSVLQVSPEHGAARSVTQLKQSAGAASPQDKFLPAHELAA
jgi:hypothetical protein